MTAVREDAAGGGWHRLGVIVLAVIVIGLPINNIVDYAALLTVVLIVACGNVLKRPHAWVMAAGLVVLATLGQMVLAPPRIEEGHNIFLPSAALEKSLPADVSAMRPYAPRGGFTGAGPPRSTRRSRPSCRSVDSCSGTWRAMLPIVLLPSSP